MCIFCGMCVCVCLSFVVCIFCGMCVCVFIFCGVYLLWHVCVCVCVQDAVVFICFHFFSFVVHRLTQCSIFAVEPCTKIMVCVCVCVSVCVCVCECVCVRVLQGVRDYSVQLLNWVKRWGAH